MSIRHFLHKLHEDERSGNPVTMATKFARRVRAHSHSAGMEAEHLLITPANAVGISNECGDYYFHRDLIADMSPEGQATLLRRVRRAVHNMFMVDQQRHGIDHALQEWHESHSPDVGPQPLPPYPQTDVNDIMLTNIEGEVGISQDIIGLGAGFVGRHLKEVSDILKESPDIKDMVVIGEDLMARDIVMQLRAQAAILPSHDTGNEQDNMRHLRKSAAAIPPDIVALYRQLEIPFVGNVPSDSPHGLSHITNGSISFNGAEGYADGVFDYRFIAAHEICHALIGHDFENNRCRYSHERQFAIPDEIAEAAVELKERINQIMGNDPGIAREWQEHQGNRMQFLSELRHVLTMMTTHHQNDANQASYEMDRGLGWDYELVCNYFALRNATFANEPDAMRFLSPKMDALCTKLEANSHLRTETLKDIDHYYNNPKRDALFALIQKDNPQITLPAPAQHR